MSSEKFTISQFLKRFSNDDKCLEEIKNIRWPSGLIPCAKCNKETKHYKLNGRKAYSCEFCRSQVYPLAGTIFDKTTTELKLWFYAIYLMTQTRSGISAKQLQRELGVTYKTAWRIFKQTRALMADGSGTPLDGIVEVDETFVGGKDKNRKNEWRHGKEEFQKEVLMGMVQRDGKVYIKHVPNTGKWTLLNQIRANVSPNARVMTDEWGSYKSLYQYGYNHNSVIHSKSQYVLGDIHTQNIENVWSHLKRGIFGVYRFVSAKYLQAYADEFAFRYNNRDAQGGMFDRLLNQVPQVRMVRASRLV